MKQIDLGQTISALANLGVIAGIVFLGIELRQNNELMTTEAHATILAANSGSWTTVLESAEIPALLIKDRDGENLTPVEEIRLNALWIRGLLNAEFAFERDSERFTMTQVDSWRRAFVAYGSLQRAWAGGGPGSVMAGRDLFTPSFVEFMDSQAVNASR